MYLSTSQAAMAGPVKKSRLPEEEEEEKEEDGESEEALKKAREFDDFKDGMIVLLTCYTLLV